MFTKKQVRFLEWIRAAHCRQQMETIFLYASAPILQGAKPSALIALSPGCHKVWEERQYALRKATGLQTMEIKNQYGKVLLLIYDEAILMAHLQDTIALNLLTKCGYLAGYTLDEALRRLQTRFLQKNFPHEVGLFLGYPPKDVQAFIENGGKNCVCCRHWKVYHDVEQAQEKFRRIDEAHRCAMEMLREPKPLHITARLLREAA